jgi:hypothetical protein
MRFGFFHWNKTLLSHSEEWNRSTLWKMALTIKQLRNLNFHKLWKIQMMSLLIKILWTCQKTIVFKEREDWRSRVREELTLEAKSEDFDVSLVQAQNWSLPRKEVIQPQVPLRLPCYDLTPIIA